MVNSSINYTDTDTDTLHSIFHTYIYQVFPLRVRIDGLMTLGFMLHVSDDGHDDVSNPVCSCFGSKVS